MAHYILNEKLNGVEIYFDSKPEDSIRSEMKASGFRWSQRQGMWYAKQSETTLTLAKKLGEQGKGVVRPERKPSTSVPVKETINTEYGVSVGDLFVDCFGYDATLHRFYQVVELKGKQTVILRGVQSEHLGAINAMSWKSKAVKDSFTTKETIMCRCRKNGNTVYAGKFYKADWNQVFDNDNYH